MSTPGPGPVSLKPEDCMTATEAGLEPEIIGKVRGVSKRVRGIYVVISTVERYCISNFTCCS